MTDIAIENKAIGPGQQLRDERLRRDMTIEQVAESLHLDRKTITHLEADELQALPPLTFVQGYVRAYCGLLDLPPEPLLSSLSEMAGGDGASLLIPRAGTDSFGGSKPRAALRVGPGPFVLGAGILILIALLVAVGWWFTRDDAALPFFTDQPSVEDRIESPESEPEPSPASDSAVTPEPEPEPTPAPIAESVSEPTPAPMAEQAPESTSASRSEQEEALTSTMGTEPTTSVAPNSVAEPAEDSTPDVTDEPSPSRLPTLASAPLESGTDVLSFRFTGDSWLEITDASGERLFFGMASSGQERLVGRAPFDIVIGNTDNVELEFAGEAVNLEEYARDKVARFTLSNS